MKTATCETIGACGVKQESDGRELQRALRVSVSEALDVQRRGHGVHGIVLAIRDSLARGEDADQLSAKVDQALDAASKHLADKGYTQDQIDAAVARFRDRLVHEIDALAGDAPASGAAQRTAVAVAAREVTRERFSLDILTAEGDKVSIRFKSLNVTNVATAQVADANDTATATATAIAIAIEANVISRGRFKLEVDGNLNDAERAAIGDLLDKVDGIARDFFGGDVQAAFAAAARVGLESDALSAFSLRLSYSKSTAMAARAYASTAALTDAPAVAAPATAPVATPPPAVSKIADAPVGDSTTPESATAPAPSAPTAPVTSARQTIASFTKDVLARLATAGNVDSVNLTMRWKMEFLVSAIGSVATTPGQQAATDALGQALDSSAA